MTTQLNTLIIEDHPFIVEGYIDILKWISSERSDVDFKIRTAHNCEQANLEIDYAVDHYILDLVFLDISLGASKDVNILSGDDLGLKLKDLFPNVKIIVLTHLSNKYRLMNILKTLNPIGLVIKSEMVSGTLKKGILSILKDVPFYSPEILKLLRQMASNDYEIDNIDRKILYYLSIGTKTKDLPKLVHLSQSGIERRKTRLKQVFNIEKKADKGLVKQAQEKGFL